VTTKDQARARITDALPGLGHNIIIAAATGAATGLAGLADQLGLTITVLGTPAEEGGGGKILMLNRGAFLFLANASDLGRPFTGRGAGARMNRASTDMGNISLRLPAIHPYLGIDSLPAVNHQPEFAAHCAGPAADRAVLDGAIALAATVIDAATRDNVRDRLLHPPGPGRP
jgi:metal-dependent amidase/aminoacylase/carboxypeptidase family protein